MSGFPFQGFPEPPRPEKSSHPKKGMTPFRITILVLVILGVFIYVASDLWTQVLWFDQLGAQRVLWTKWLSILAIVAVATVVNATIVGLNMNWAHKKRPRSMLGGRSESLMQYQEKMASLRRVIFWGVPLIIGLFTGLGLAADWRQIIMWMNRTPFGVADPQFNTDVSFYVFTLPLLKMILSLLTTVFVVSLLASIVVHYLYGAIQVAPRFRVTRPARRQVGILAAILSLVVGLRYWIAPYRALVETTGSPSDGALYAQVNAYIPAQLILAVISVLVAVLFVVAAFRGTWHLPVAGVAVTVVSALVLGMAYPALIQQFKVRPNERALQSPYIQHNIDATLAAYDLENVEVQTYAARTDTATGQLRDDAASTQQIRLIDPDIISPTVRQLKQSRSYYTFEDQLNVDRYEIDGQKRDTVIAVREIDLEGLDNNEQNWVNRHTIFTHGYGVVAAYGNRVDSKGEPQWWEDGIPSTGDVGEYEQRVYFSPNSPEYSIVGAPEGTDPLELDYPDEQSGGQVPTTFDGDGGPSIGNFFNKLLFAIKFQSTNIFFASQINSESQILYDRDPALRVSKVAPYLTLDRKPYPAVVDVDGDPSTPKRLVWIVDAYTTSNHYPYAQHVNVSSATADASTQDSALYAAQPNINYMRNSVKAVVDAYDGSVSLYQWDEEDPILKSWMKTFPGQVKPLADISGDLMAHLRYPQDLFKVQRSLLAAYHVTEAGDFYTGGDRWRLSENPTSVRNVDGSTPVQPPYYLTMQMPGQESAEFSLTSVFVPGGRADREPMAGFLAVDSETGSEAGKVREGYGQLRLLALPSSTTVPGPGQVQNNFNANAEIARELNLMDQEGSEVILGNLLTLPVGGGLLYVQPVYLQGTGSTKYPVLRKVMTAFGDSVGFSETLEGALDMTFKGDSAAELAEGTGSKDGSGSGDGEESDLSTQQKLTSALQGARDAIMAGEDAMKVGDWAEYGKQQQRLQSYLTQALRLQNELDTQSQLSPEELTVDAPEPTAAPTEPEGTAAK
ncbi:UPF0182 family membrane protein [Actinomyces urinae]|uniref:UPF0182 family membrane protein n=1 Tax=Actinomyces urinae TaxID=1689268 RepID=UPI0009315658|nr:UPF0182 family protein [Actinomyces urinae]